MNNDFVLMLSSTALDYVVKMGIPIVAPDFSGYLMQISEDIMLAIKVDGTFIIYSIRGKKLSRHKINHMADKLLKINFIELVTPEPFPEFSEKLNVPFLRQPIKLDEPLFTEVI